MADRKAFLLRIDPAVLDALQLWADDELRSLNGQIEYVLRRVLQAEGRLKKDGTPPALRISSITAFDDFHDSPGIRAISSPQTQPTATMAASSSKFTPAGSKGAMSSVKL